MVSNNYHKKELISQIYIFFYMLNNNYYHLY